MSTTTKLPDDLMVGVATAATHIEGGELGHTWYRWSELGKIQDGSHSRVACDHVNRVEEDVDLIKALHCQTYRMGLEWARIEPENGEFSQEGIAIYRKELLLLQANGIHPLVTLWHFSNPLWIEDLGGWANPQTIHYFLRYVDFVVSELGDLVTDWITINEPNVYLFFAYFDGVWPPGHHGDIRSFLKGGGHLSVAHIKAYSLIHSHYKGKSNSAKVGVAHHLRVFDPLDHRLLTKMSIKLMRHIFQGMFLIAMTDGVFRFPLSKRGFGISKGKYADFIGINYYSRDMVRGVFNPLTLFGERSTKEESKVNDLGWEIYPEGMSRVVNEVSNKYALPIFITENGVCDSKDELRSQFIQDHLKVLIDAINQGARVERYYHWSLLDNFEWDKGNSARFGLYHTNYENQRRTLRPSGEYFRQICQHRQI